VHLDNVIETVRDTSRDKKEKNKGTPRSRLAVDVIEC